jgi:PTH2 family peptidyl-tRNA hydrolase
MKQVIVVRKDLNMRKGKIAAQVAHASLGAVFQLGDKLGDKMVIPYSGNLKHWMENEFTKICVSCDSYIELLTGLNAYLIQDSGRTEFNNVPTYTCLAIGPDEDEAINEITGHLKLL